MSLFLQTEKQDNLLYDSAGKSLEASLVFEHIIRYLKERALGIIQKLDINTKIDDIEYVFTVPGISGEIAKLLIREAAIKVIAGDTRWLAFLSLDVINLLK